MDTIRVESIRQRVERVLSSPPDRLDSASLIIHDSYKFGLLTEEEKVFLCNIVQQYHNSPRPEERELARQAMGLLVSCHLRLVINMAKRFASQQLPLEDLVQAGCMGVMTAVLRFSPERNAKVTTWIVWWVRQRMQVMLSQYLRRTKSKKQDYPTIISLDEESEYESIENIAEEEEEDDDDDGFGQLAGEKLRAMIADLPPSEAVALCLRYGIGCNGYSYEEIARAMRVSRETARVLVQRAIARLRHPRRKRVLSKFV